MVLYTVCYYLKGMDGYIITIYMVKVMCNEIITHHSAGSSQIGHKLESHPPTQNMTWTNKGKPG